MAMATWYMHNDHPHATACCTHNNQAATGTRRFGVLTVRDPRTTHAHNDHFLDMLERYFAQEDARKMEDVREEFAFQVGATPAFQETPKCAFDPGCLELIRGVCY